jgi:hypothetical protein
VRHSHDAGDLAGVGRVDDGASCAEWELARRPAIEGHGAGAAGGAEEEEGGAVGGSCGDGGGLPECGVVLGGAVVLVVRVQHVLRRCVPLSLRARSGIQVRSICWVWEWRSFPGGEPMDDTGCSSPFGFVGVGCVG